MNTVVTQALATGLPVIVTEHSGLPDQVQEGVNGSVVPEGDVPALAEKILFYVTHSELWAQLGKQGREHVKAYYNAPDLVERQIQLYRAVIDGASVPLP